MDLESIDRRENDSWHLDKKVPLGLIFAVCAQGAMVVWAIADIKKDVEVLKAENVLQRDRDVRQDARIIELQRTVGDQLSRIDSKLDRLIEKKI